jgi:uncharacterized protein YukE
MADIDIDYDTISTVSGLLNGAEQNILPQITTLHTTVDNMLMQDGGLWMSQTSPAIQAQYETFNSAALQCCNAISSFANMFSTLVTNLQSMDQKMASSIANPTSS